MSPDPTKSTPTDSSTSTPDPKHDLKEASDAIARLVRS